MYDQNRPDDPQRPTGEERPARRRLGRSWGPPAEEAPDTADEGRQGQAPEQYRFDPDRGRRHRYSEDPTGQVPNVEIAETGPMVPATRRPSPGEQFEPIPAAPQTPQGPQGFQAEPAQPRSPFAPPGVNHERSAPPPGANHERNASPGVNQDFSAPGANRERGAAPEADHDAAAGQESGAPSGPPQEFGVQPSAPREFGVPQIPSQGLNGSQTPNRQAPAQRLPSQDFNPQQGAPQSFGVPPAAPQEFGIPQQHPGYSAPPAPGDYAAPRQGPAQPGPNQEFAPPEVNQEYSAPPGANQEYSAPRGANQEFSAPPGEQFSAPRASAAGPTFAPPGAKDFHATPGANPEHNAQSDRHSAPATPNQQYSTPAHPQDVSAPSGPREYTAPPATPEPVQERTSPAVAAPSQTPHTGPIEIPPPPVPQTPGAPPAPTPQTPVPLADQQTDQFPIVQPPVTEFSPPAVPSPTVTEQAPLRTAPADRPPFAEPTPPATVDKTPGPADPEPERLVEAVRQVPGVRDAFHVTAPDGASSLRLELEEGVDPDEVHTAVSAVVAEQRAVDLGPQSADEPGEELHGQVEAPAAEVDIPALGPVELRRVDIESAGLEAEVTVTLSLGKDESTGKVAVPPIDWHIQHAAAAATVEALRPRLGASDIRVEVEHASIVPTGPVKTAVVVVLWLDGQAVRRLSGAAVVTAERSRAVVSATLGALAAEVSH